MPQQFNAQRFVDTTIAYYRNTLTPANGQRHFLLACFQKSGSTYMSAIMSQLLGAEPAHLVPGYDRREQELTVDRLALYHEFSYVAQHHIRCSDPTLELCERFNLYPIVQIRNIFDVVMSTIDHWHNISVKMPMAYVTNDIANADLEERYRFFAEMMAPWFINFFVSWVHCPRPFSWVRYENLIANPVEVVSRVCAESGWDVSDEAVAAAIEKAGGMNTRLNKGKAGRGTAVPEPVKDLIRAQTRFYPDVDFSPIGL